MSMLVFESWHALLTHFRRFSLFLIILFQYSFFKPIFFDSFELYYVCWPPPNHFRDFPPILKVSAYFHPSILSLTIFPCFHSFLIIFYFLQLPLPTFNHYQPFLPINNHSYPFSLFLTFLNQFSIILSIYFTIFKPYHVPTLTFNCFHDPPFIFKHNCSFLPIFALFLIYFNHFLQPSFTTSNHFLAIFTNTYSFQQPVTTPSHFRPFEFEQAYTPLATSLVSSQ